MNAESAVCVRCPGPLFPPRSERALKPGEFLWEDGYNEDGTRHLYIVLPGDESPTAIRVVKGPPGGERVWGWDGNEDYPTLWPSIHWLGHWHGFLTAGRLVSC